jgi:hypothetical protein
VLCNTLSLQERDRYPTGKYSLSNQLHEFTTWANQIWRPVLQYLQATIRPLSSYSLLKLTRQRTPDRQIFASFLSGLPVLPLAAQPYFYTHLHQFTTWTHQTWRQVLQYLQPTIRLVSSHTTPKLIRQNTPDRCAVFFFFSSVLCVLLLAAQHCMVTLLHEFTTWTHQT